MTTGQAIKFYRLKNLMSQGDLAKAMGYKNSSTITKIEKGINTPPLKTLRRIAQVLGVELKDIIGE